MARKTVGVEVAAVPERRRYAPCGIAVLLAPIVRPALRRRGAALASLLEDWPAIVGPEIAARSLPVKCSGGTLTLGCTGPDALELQHAGPALIARINQALGGMPVVRLRFADMKPAAAPDRKASQRPVLRRNDAPRGSAGCRPASLPDGPLGAALERLRRGLDQGGG